MRTIRAMIRTMTQRVWVLSAYGDPPDSGPMASAKRTASPKTRGILTTGTRQPRPRLGRPPAVRPTRALIGDSPRLVESGRAVGRRRRPGARPRLPTLEAGLALLDE